MEKSSITVLMSSYNGEKYIREQLDSILNQDLGNTLELKLLIRDDGSTDSTPDILEEYRKKSDGRVKYYIGKNLKTEKSFWNLINTAENSDYFAFSDQDDVWFSDKLKRAVKVLKKMAADNADVPLLYFSRCTTVNSDLIIKPSIHDELNRFTDFPHSLVYSTAQGCTFVFNSALREKLKKYDMDVNFVEYHDWLTHKVAAMFGKAYFDKRPSMYYRQHGENVIGMQNGGIEGFIRRIKMFVSRRHESLRRQCAKSLLDVYGDEIPEEQKDILKELAYYRNSKYYKKKFIKDKRFYPGGINTLFHIFLIVCGKI